MVTDKVNWGMIGAGDVTEVKSGPAFNKVDDSRLLMVMRRDLEKAKDYAERHHIPHCTNNADDIFNNPEINAIYVATPPSSHAEYTVRAADAGKHVYVEKPMARSYSECKEMIRACDSNGVKLFVAYYRRELDYFKKIKELVDGHGIGQIRYVEIKLVLPPTKADYDRDHLPWRVDPKIAGAGYFYDLASHQFDFLDYVFGPVKSARGHSSNQLNLYEAEDIVTASFTFESNILGSGLWCFTSEAGERIDTARVTGSEGTLTFSFFGRSPIEVTKDGETSSYSIDYPQHVQQPLIDTIVRDILGEGKCMSTGESGARTNWVLEQILAE
jgi:predicted dehydrogenase